MVRGLLAPLGPQEEIALRRIAHGSFAIDVQVTARLVQLALVERSGGTLRLTPLGRMRFEALPKAPLQARQRPLRVVAEYVTAVIEKAQSLAKVQPVADDVAPLEEIVAEHVDESVEDERLGFPIDLFPDLRNWRVRAERNMTETRRLLLQHRHRQEKLCDDSRHRIAISRSLLKHSTPVIPAWMTRLQ